ncbi:MAG: DUF126 domain-containing protein [Clostridia bacterium]|nr:DUF126 domain-containing protein [Clostridia bacterium]MBR2892228.1 DUF126 domain-containing protein [Clostridia bacterium]
MAKEFKGRPVIAGECTVEAVVSRQGFNTLASFQKSALAKKKETIVSDQNNSDLFGKNITGKALCLPQTIGSTTGGMVIYTATALKIHPRAMLFSEPIDSLAAAGVILADVWTNDTITAVDNLGQEFLDYVQDGMKVEIKMDGTVIVG